MRLTSFTRLISVVSSTALLFSSSFAGIYAAGESIGGALAQWARGKPGHYTDSPRPIYRGPNPRRDPATRGGMWSNQALEAARLSKVRRPATGIGGAVALAEAALFAGESIGAPALDRHGLIVSPEPGSALPWEGSYGGVNSGNGNKLTSLHLFSWKTRGGMTVDFTLFHNSQTSYNDELGYGWTWTYDMYINHSGATATV